MLVRRSMMVLCLGLSCQQVFSAQQQKQSGDRTLGRVLVTGGSGFVGRNLIRTLLKDGVQVHAVARSQAAKQQVEQLGAVGFVADLNNLEQLRAAAQGCDTAVHAAASLSQWGGLEEAIRVNEGGTSTVMRACEAEGVGRVVHVGTEAAAVGYDGAALRGIDESVPLPEKPFPGTYTITKNLAERAALRHNSDKLEVVVVRPRFIWGGDDTVLLANFVNATNQGLLKWFDGGNYKMSTCHVDNVIEGILLAAKRGRPGHSYYLTDGAPVHFREFVSEMLESVGVTPPTGSIPSWLVWASATAAEWTCTVLGCDPFVSRQSLVLIAQEVTVVDTKARRELGYTSHVSREQGMKGLRQTWQTDSQKPMQKSEL